MVVRKNTAQDTIWPVKTRKKSKPSKDYLDVISKQWFWKSNPFDFQQAFKAKPLTKFWKLLKQFADELSKKIKDLTTSSELEFFDEELWSFFKKEWFSVLSKKWRRFITEKVSASETTQELSETKRTFSIPDQKLKEVENARIALCMATVDAYAEWLKAMKKFKWFTDTRLKMWIFISLPESEWLFFRHLADHMWISDKTMYSQQFHHEVEMVRAFIMKKHFMKHTPKVVNALVSAASETDSDWKYNTQAMKLFLQYAESWKEWINLNHDVKWWFNVSFGVQKSQFINPEDWQKALEHNDIIEADEYENDEDDQD